MYRFVVYQGQDQQWYWRLVGPNNRPIAASGEGFETRHAAMVSAQLVQREAPGALAPS